MKIIFRKVNCSNCGQPQKYFRIPKTIKQFLWGGYTCPKCQSELDAFGKLKK